MINTTIAEVTQFLLYGCSGTSLALALMIRFANTRDKGVMAKATPTAPRRKGGSAKGTGHRPVPVRSFVPTRTPDR